MDEGGGSEVGGIEMESRSGIWYGDEDAGGDFDDADFVSVLAAAFSLVGTTSMPEPIDSETCCKQHPGWNPIAITTDCI